jgi:hypothetical protein
LLSVAFPLRPLTCSPCPGLLLSPILVSACAQEGWASAARKEATTLLRQGLHTNLHLAAACVPGLFLNLLRALPLLCPPPTRHPRSPTLSSSASWCSSLGRRCTSRRCPSPSLLLASSRLRAPRCRCDHCLPSPAFPGHVIAQGRACTQEYSARGKPRRFPLYSWWGQLSYVARSCRGA